MRHGLTRSLRLQHRTSRCACAEISAAGRRGVCGQLHDPACTAPRRGRPSSPTPEDKSASRRTVSSFGRAEKQVGSVWPCGLGRICRHPPPSAAVRRIGHRCAPQGTLLRAQARTAGMGSRADERGGSQAWGRVPRWLIC
jgi:hypothetical protein